MEPIHSSGSSVHLQGQSSPGSAGEATLSPTSEAAGFAAFELAAVSSNAWQASGLPMQCADYVDNCLNRVAIEFAETCVGFSMEWYAKTAASHLPPDAEPESLENSDKVELFNSEIIESATESWLAMAQPHIDTWKNNPEYAGARQQATDEATSTWGQLIFQQTAKLSASQQAEEARTGADVSLAEEALSNVFDQAFAPLGFRGSLADWIEEGNLADWTEEMGNLADWTEEMGNLVDWTEGQVKSDSVDAFSDAVAVKSEQNFRPESNYIVPASPDNNAKSGSMELPVVEASSSIPLPIIQPNSTVAAPKATTPRTKVSHRGEGHHARWLARPQPHSGMGVFSLNTNNNAEKRKAKTQENGDLETQHDNKRPALTVPSDVDNANHASSSASQQHVLDPDAEKLLDAVISKTLKDLESKPFMRAGSWGVNLFKEQLNDQMSRQGVGGIDINQAVERYKAQASEPTRQSARLANASKSQGTL